MRSTQRTVIFAVLIFSLVGIAFGQTTEFTYQGNLSTAGLPAAGNYDFEFVLYDAVSGGAQIGPTLTRSAVAVAGGTFSVRLDFGANFPGANRYLEIRVRPTGEPGITILSPRQFINSSPYAVKSISADNALNATNATNAVSAATATNATQLNGQGAAFYLNASNIASGTLNPSRLPVPLTLSGSNSSHIIRGDNAGISGTGVFGNATSATGLSEGVAGYSSSTDGTGVLGLATAGTGLSFGVKGLTSSTQGRGVSGTATATTGLAFGGYFSSDSTSGRGVYGVANAGSGITEGGYFVSNSTSGRGVFGIAGASTGSAFGGVFQSSSTSGRAVYGIATALSGTIYGVYGLASTGAGGYAVYAAGDMGGSGVKPFRIDHPDDPENRYLLHYASESPEVINFYRGTVLLDGSGEAVVELPGYFAKINKTPSYTLTAVGAPMPSLHVAKEIDEAALSAGAMAAPGVAAPKCTFRIAGGAPGAKVSWRVEAVRNDRWVRTRGTGVEVEKQGVEKGTYQHPELYGQPKEKGMNYEAEKERKEPVVDPKPSPRASGGTLTVEGK